MLLLTKTESPNTATKFSSLETMFHMHASRPGPVLSNEIILSIKEYQRNPNLRKIIGVQQPGGTAAKFMSYWLGGLSESLRTVIMKNAQKRISNGNLADILCLQADTVDYSVEDFVDDCVAPLYDSFKDQLNNAGFNETTLQTMRKLDAEPNLASVMTACSLAMLNTVLRHYRLPIVQIVRVPESLISKYGSSKHINTDTMRMRVHEYIDRKRKQTKHSFDFINKDLKCYTSPPNELQLYRLLRRFQNNRSHKNMRLGTEDIAHYYHERTPKHPPIYSYLDLIDSAYTKSITNGRGDLPFVSGEDMVRIMFEIAARQDGVYIAVQEFMRSFDYSVYDSLTEQYTDLPAQFAAFKTWDTEAFPEFDTNLVFGLKYLKF